LDDKGRELLFIARALYRHVILKYPDHTVSDAWYGGQFRDGSETPDRVAIVYNAGSQTLTDTLQFGQFSRTGQINIGFWDMSLTPFLVRAQRIDFK
jgi:hypothetical protein